MLTLIACMCYDDDTSTCKYILTSSNRSASAAGACRKGLRHVSRGKAGKINKVNNLVGPSNGAKSLASGPMSPNRSNECKLTYAVPAHRDTADRKGSFLHEAVVQQTTLSPPRRPDSDLTAYLLPRHTLPQIIILALWVLQAIFPTLHMPFLKAT